MIQETKLYRKNMIKFDEYEIFKRVRKKKKGGGGIMIGIKKEVQTTPPVDVSPEDEEVEILVVETQMQEMTVCFFNWLWTPRRRQ